MDVHWPSVLISHRFLGSKRKHLGKDNQDTPNYRWFLDMFGSHYLLKKQQKPSDIGAYRLFVLVLSSQQLFSSCFLHHLLHLGSLDVLMCCAIPKPPRRLQVAVKVSMQLKQKQRAWQMFCKRSASTTVWIQALQDLPQWWKSSVPKGF